MSRQGSPWFVAGIAAALAITFYGQFEIFADLIEKQQELTKDAIGIVSGLGRNNSHILGKLIYIEDRFYAVSNALGNHVAQEERRLKEEEARKARIRKWIARNRKASESTPADDTEEREPQSSELDE